MAEENPESIPCRAIGDLDVANTSGRNALSPPNRQIWYIPDHLVLLLGT